MGRPVVDRGELGVEPLEHPLGDARHVAEPGGRDDHEDVGVDDPRAKCGPGVALAHVRLDARGDVEVDDPHDVAVGPATGEAPEELLGHELAAGVLGGVLQCAVEEEDGLVGDAHVLPFVSSLPFLSAIRRAR